VAILLMPISNYSIMAIGGYWWILVVINGNYIGGYWWLFYYRPLVVILLVSINGYSISVYLSQP
jgi:hypothetical protein